LTAYHLGVPTDTAPSDSTPAVGAEQAQAVPAHADVRRSRLYLLSRRSWAGLVRRGASIVSLAGLDALGLALGLYVALVLRELVYGRTPIYFSLLWEGPRHWLRFLIPITLIVFWQAGLYAQRERRAGAGRVVSSLVLVAVIVLAFGLGSGYHFSTTGIVPTATVTSAVVILALRAAYESISLELLRTIGVRRRAVLVGDGEGLQRLHRSLGATRSGIEYSFLGAIGGSAPDGLARLGGLDDLARVLEEVGADELILSEADFDERRVLGIVEAAHRLGVRVRLAPRTTELLVQQGEYVPGQGVPLFELRPPVLTGAEWALKRSFDLAVASLVAVAGLPLWLLVAAAIKLDSRGPVLYVDRRVGVGEREFGMLKFRTMVAGAAARQPELEEANEASGALFKIRDDPRVTRVGRLLRRFSVDELPQVLNVLRGEMSLVGPRPLPLRDYRLLDEWHRKRYLVLPGMTGLWQISGRSSLTFDDLVRLDFTYLENWSIWLDVSIILRTFPAVLARRGAY
jgi:exopolysaccharide biosynthesis polyprenyl glycosylphosphotransferase